MSSTMPLFLLVTFGLIGHILALQWVNLSQTVYVPEDTPIGAVIYNLTVSGVNSSVIFLAKDHDTRRLVNITGATNHNNGLWSADVILNQELDRDFGSTTRSLMLIASDGINEVDGHFVLLINDVNDNPPSFENLHYRLTIPEIATNGTTLIDNIRATDPDNGGLADTPYHLWGAGEEVLSLFYLNLQSQYHAALVLNGTLDYETRSLYTLKISATDSGGLNSSADITVTVEGVQDTPPVFLMDSYRGSVLEEQPAGTSILRLTAQDGDHGQTNRVQYFIIQGNTRDFAIDQDTGQISTRRRLDREAPDVISSDGVYHLVVEAQEANDTFPQLGDSNATVEVIIRLEDINDNPPNFTASTFTAFIRVDSPLNSIIYFDGDGYMEVNDRDQGPHAHCQLTVERGGQAFPVFRPSPSNVYSQAFVLIRLNSSSGLDEFVDTHLIFHVVVREVSTPQRFSSSATILLTVEPAVVITTTTQKTLTQAVVASDIVVYVMGGFVLLSLTLVVVIVYRLTCHQQAPSSLSRNRYSSKMLKYYLNLPTPVGGFRPEDNSEPSLASLESAEPRLIRKDNSSIPTVSTIIPVSISEVVSPGEAEVEARTHI